MCSERTTYCAVNGSSDVHTQEWCHCSFSHSHKRESVNPERRLSEDESSFSRDSVLLEGVVLQNVLVCNVSTFLHCFAFFLKRQGSITALSRVCFNTLSIGNWQNSSNVPEIWIFCSCIGRSSPVLTEFLKILFLLWYTLSAYTLD